MTDETAVRVRVRIEGRVQGIGFRFWASDQAVELGLGGWVRNRFDGGVEAVFAGPRAAVAEMVRRCQSGPAYARVDHVAEEPETEPVGPGFHIAPTA